MLLAKKKLLAAFLEKDNLKLLVYEVGGLSAKRLFAGQITFSTDVVRDVFIADAVKFNNQVKVAFSQKPPLADVTDVALFLPPDKTFTKTMPMSDSVDSFIQSLPYFAEELVIQTEGIETTASPRLRARDKEAEGRVTHVAFEKKLIEDLQRPFLESGKKVVALKSSLGVLTVGNRQEGKYLLLVPFDKEIAAAVAADGGITETATFAKDVFAGRLAEFIANHNLSTVKQAYTVGVFDADIAGKLRSGQGLEVTALSTGDVYDATVFAYARSAGGGGLGAILGRISLGGINGRLPGQKYLFLGGAVIVGFVLVVVLVKGIGKVNFKLPSFGKKQAPPAQVTEPVPKPPEPEPKPADYPVRVLNGTLVAGEAGKFGDVLKGMGYPIVETKNATTSGFVNTRLRVATDVPQKIIESLKGTILTTYSGVLVEPMASDSAKIEIIIGTKKS